jgi:hypothetical protein
VLCRLVGLTRSDPPSSTSNALGVQHQHQHAALCGSCLTTFDRGKPQCLHSVALLPADVVCCRQRGCMPGWCAAIQCRSLGVVIVSG